MYHAVNKEKKLLDLLQFTFISLYLLLLTFEMKLKNTNNKSLLNISAFCDQWKMMPNLNMSHEKMSNYVSFSLFGFTVVIKQGKCNFECHWNTLIFFDKKYMASDWNTSHWKMPDFVSLSWFMFTLVIKLHFSHRISL